jgi:hypothetical protein
MTAMSKFHGGMIEAFKGYFEENWETRRDYEKSGELAFDGWYDGYIQTLIALASNKERLRVYLEWNGILGYTESIFDIATNGGEYEE